MENEKDRFGEKMRLMEQAKEDIYFAAKDRELIEKLRTALKKVERTGKEAQPLACPKCASKLESHTFLEFLLDRCESCGGIWLDKGELEGILRKVSQSPISSLIKRLLARHQASEAKGVSNDAQRKKIHNGLQEESRC